MIIDSHEHIMFPTNLQLDKMDAAGVDKTILFCSAPHPEKAATQDWQETQITSNSLCGIGEFTSGSEQQILLHPVTLNGIRLLMSLCKKYPEIPVILRALKKSVSV